LAARPDHDAGKAARHEDDRDHDDKADSDQFINDVNEP
jgi:hypothetical protein